METNKYANEKFIRSLILVIVSATMDQQLNGRVLEWDTIEHIMHDIKTNRSITLQC